MALGKVSGCVLMAVCLVAMAHAFNYDRVEKMTIDDSTENYLETEQLDIAVNVLEQLRQLLDSAGKGNSGCQCTGLRCQCCQDISVPRIPFRKICLGVAFIPNEAAVTLELKVDGRVIIRQKFSVRKPITICVPIPTTPVRICLSLHDVQFDLKSFSGCFRIAASIFGFEVFHTEVGCVHINYLDSPTTVQFSKALIVEAAAFLKTSNMAYLKQAIPMENIEDAPVDSEI